MRERDPDAQRIGGAMSDTNTVDRRCAEESRRRILDAAEDLFTERGFAHTSFADIAQRCRIGRGSILWHFRDKDALAMAVAERVVERVCAADGQSSASPLADVVREVAVLLHGGESTLMFEVLVKALGAQGGVRQHHRDYFARRRKSVEDFLRRRRPAHVDPATAARQEGAAAAALNGALWGIHLQVLLDSDAVDLDAALLSVVTMFDKNLDDVWRT
ncbi:TetR/AcrR family transcriptional regulator [Lentzea sp. NPDC060358]|uniref:TetR/AcrR family transcriptional regulator n=1 Tax=Lentzea sp. NPDC060358 TaxID=3347103 RepID=UPI0036511436